MGAALISGRVTWQSCISLWLDFSLYDVCVFSVHTVLLCLMYVCIYWQSSAPSPFLRLDFGQNYLSWVHWTDYGEPHRAYIWWVNVLIYAPNWLRVSTCVCARVYVCVRACVRARVCLLKWEYLFWWKMQKVSWINNGRNFWCLSSWPN